MNIARVVVVLTAVAVVALSCSNKDEAGDVPAQFKEGYYCPMHTEVRSDKPGVCPICNMDLVKWNDETKSHADNMPGLIRLSTQKQVLANVSTIKVMKEPLIKELAAYAYLDFAEQNRKVVSARFNGRIEKMFVTKTGELVTIGQPLFEIYSPELVQAQQEYLIALDHTASIRKLSLSDTVSGRNSLMKAARKRLELYGVTDDQLFTLESSREIQYTLTYYSPIGGTVIERKVQEGMYVNEGTLIYDIADLSLVWSIAEIYERDLPLIKTGRKVKLRLEAYPDENFEGIVSLIYPVINSQTRTVKVRSEFSNMHHKLKPQMYGEIVFREDLGQQLLIPEEAVLFTGMRQIVWVKTGEEQFESREVTVGIKSDGKYQILSGLKEGDEAAVSGGFLIDSESQLKGGMAAGHEHEDLKMSDDKSQ